MSTSRLARCCLVLASLTPIVSHAQTQTLDILNVYSAMALVDSVHPSIKSKRQDVLSAESARSSARQQMLPILSASRGRGNTDGSKQLTTASLQQPLFAGGRISGGIDKAEAQIRESESLLLQTRRDLMSQIGRAHV